MRKNQVEIKITRFSDEIPNSVKEKENIEQEMVSYEMNTYADSNDVFEALAAAYFNILEQIKTIRECLDTIDNNWTGPEHDNAAQDKKNAEENMDKAVTTINSMNGAIAKLSTNANKISYNG